MTEHPSGMATRSALMIVGRYILYVVLGIALSCGACYLLVYLWFNYDYIRANYAASRAEGRVEKIYEQMREAVPSGVALISEETPQSSIEHMALSASAPQYAHVWAQQIYTASIPFNDVAAAYKGMLNKWEWDELPIPDETESINFAFRHPSDKNLIVGLCLPSETHPTQYIVFFDFHEMEGCGEFNVNRLICLASAYCD